MMNSLIKSLVAKKNQLVDCWPAENQELDDKVQKALDSSNVSTLKNSLPDICYDNLSACLNLRNDVLNSGDASSVCMFVHGSTGRGEGQVAPNIKFTFERQDNMWRMNVEVEPNCRDDLDVVMVVEDVQEWEQAAVAATKRISDQGIPITLNLLSKASAETELTDPDSPAFRRILLFNRSKCILNSDYLVQLKQLAELNQTALDLPHEIDFKVLMSLADIMVKLDMNAYSFSEEELLVAFPSLLLSCMESLHIGFPRIQKKISYS